jgi:hypothetical protein
VVEDPPEHLCNEWAAWVCLRGGVAVAATHPVLRNLDSNVGLFRNAVGQVL